MPKSKFLPFKSIARKKVHARMNAVGKSVKLRGILATPSGKKAWKIARSLAVGDTPVETVSNPSEVQRDFEVIANVLGTVKDSKGAFTGSNVEFMKGASGANWMSENLSRDVGNTGGQSEGEPTAVGSRRGLATTKGSSRYQSGVLKGVAPLASAIASLIGGDDPQTLASTADLKTTQRPREPSEGEEKGEEKGDAKSIDEWRKIVSDSKGLLNPSEMKKLLKQAKDAAKQASKDLDPKDDSLNAQTLRYGIKDLENKIKSTEAALVDMESAKNVQKESAEEKKANEASIKNVMKDLIPPGAKVKIDLDAESSPSSRWEKDEEIIHIPSLIARVRGMQSTETWKSGVRGLSRTRAVGLDNALEALIKRLERLDKHYKTNPRPARDSPEEKVLEGYLEKIDRQAEAYETGINKVGRHKKPASPEKMLETMGGVVNKIARKVDLGDRQFALNDYLKTPTKEPATDKAAAAREAKREQHRGGSGGSTEYKAALDLSEMDESTDSDNEIINLIDREDRGSLSPAVSNRMEDLKKQLDLKKRSLAEGREAILRRLRIEKKDDSDPSTIEALKELLHRYVRGAAARLKGLGPLSPSRDEIKAAIGEIKNEIHLSDDNLNVDVSSDDRLIIGIDRAVAANDVVRLRAYEEIMANMPEDERRQMIRKAPLRNRRTLRMIELAPLTRASDSEKKTKLALAILGGAAAVGVAAVGSAAVPQPLASTAGDGDAVQKTLASTTPQTTGVDHLRTLPPSTTPSSFTEVPIQSNQGEQKGVDAKVPDISSTKGKLRPHFITPSVDILDIPIEERKADQMRWDLFNYVLPTSEGSTGTAATNPLKAQALQSERHRMYDAGIDRVTGGNNCLVLPEWGSDNVSKPVTDADYNGLPRIDFDNYEQSDIHPDAPGMIRPFADAGIYEYDLTTIDSQLLSRGVKQSVLYGQCV